MKRIAAYLASAALGTVLVGSGPAWAQMRSGGMGGSPDIAWRGYPYNPDNYAYNYGYPYNYAYGYGCPSSYVYGYGYGYPYANSYGYANPFTIVTAPIAALTAPAKALTAPGAGVAAAPFAVATSATAPLVTGRSVATGTPVKTCELYHASSATA